MAQWARRGTLGLCPPGWASRCQCGGISQPAKASSTQATSMSPEQWKIVYRAFLFHVHPDFFQDQPKERMINEKGLKVLQQHLDQLEHAPKSHTTQVSNEPGNGCARVVFFLKPGGRQVDADVTGWVGGTDSMDHVDGKDCSKEANDSPLPQKVILPLQSHRIMAHLLYDAGITPPPVPLHSARNEQPLTKKPSKDSEGANKQEWDDWAAGLFGGTPANRAWDEAAKKKRRSEECRQFGGSMLGSVLATDAGKNLVRERRASSRNVVKLVKELREQHGFGEFAFRCGWSKSNLCMALRSLLETCNEHRPAFKVPNFGRLNVVFGESASTIYKGEIRLCPADVPLEWVSVLQGITPKLLSSVEKHTRELLLLEGKASTILRGARLSRGLSCSHNKYDMFLGGICMAGADLNVGDKSATDMSYRNWSSLRCRVEEGFGHSSKVLEDGTIQVGSGMTLAKLSLCLGRNYLNSSAAATESSKLATAVTETAARCRLSLGLESIDRANAVSLVQMVSACEALVRFSEDSSANMEADAVAARRRLRGHCVRVVRPQLGGFDGLTEDGEISIPWDWAGDKGNTYGRQASAAWQSSSSYC